jgi:23S rRNA (uridine2552-2'-O)-methyltransferase
MSKNKQKRGSNNKDYFQQLRDKFGLLSRAFFKLKYLDEKYKLFSEKKEAVLELGAAPGGWSQYIIKKTKNLLAVDLLPLKLSGVEFIQADLFDFSTDRKFDIILSDIAPNLSGNWSVDNAKMEAILHRIFDFVDNNLKPGGKLIVKIFDNYDLLDYRKKFTQIRICKPPASRKQSRESYLVMLGFLNGNKK